MAVLIARDVGLTKGEKKNTFEKIKLYSIQGV